LTRLFALLFCLLPGLHTPAVAATGDSKKAELQGKQGELRGRIDALSRDISKAEASKGYAADQLRETESAISDANRRLHELGSERDEVQHQLGDLTAQGQRLDRQTSGQQNQLARLLNRQFVGGDSDALKMLLAGRDPNQAARDRYFLTQLSRSKADLIQQLQAIAAEKQKLAEAARERQEQLSKIERKQQEQHAQLLERKKQRQATIASIADRIKAQQREIDSLKRNDQRLSKLIDGLAKIVVSKKSAPQKVGAGDTAKKGKTPAAKAGRSAVKDNDPGAIGGAFASLRGKLRLPVRGDIAGRFGSARAEGGTNWKGVFIRAAEGAEVKAIAAGAVVFSDWLRGFGNLLIVDHGDDFLSIYGNNESLLAAVGSNVTAGQSVATVGNSGGNPESGLYFELRHRGQPFDPLKWVGVR
jgi:septal ring factor EnvC (AmiA/AmiB activator)